MTTPVTRSRATMSDVAAAAGVSLKTVSRVVNGTEIVSPARLQRVQAAIEQLGFRRNEFARQLRQGTTATIGLVLEDVADPFYSALTRAVEEIALERNHMLLASSAAEDPQRARRLIESLGARGIDGLIVTPSTGIDAAFLQAEAAAGSTMVFVDRPVPGFDVDTVLSDNLGGARQGARALIDSGHRRIAFFGDADIVFTASERRAGYLAAMTDARLAVDDALVVMDTPTTAAAGLHLARMLALPEPPTAILSGNNRWSIALLRALREIETIIAFVGFDDFELADVLNPGITVIAQNPTAMGRLAAEMLFRRIDGDTSPPQRVQLGVTLVRRGSESIAARA